MRAVFLYSPPASIYPTENNRTRTQKQNNMRNIRRRKNTNRPYGPNAKTNDRNPDVSEGAFGEFT